MNIMHRSRKANTHNGHSSSNGPNPWLDNNTHVWIHKPSNLTVVNLRDTTEKLELTASNPMLTKLMAALNAKDKTCANELSTPDISSVESAITTSMQTPSVNAANDNVQEQQKQREQQERLKQLIAKICVDKSTANESIEKHSINKSKSDSNSTNNNILNFIKTCKEQSQKNQTTPLTNTLTTTNNTRTNFTNTTNNVSNNSVFSNLFTKLESANTLRSIPNEAPPSYASSVIAHTPSSQITSLVNNVSMLKHQQQQHMEQQREGNKSACAFTPMRTENPQNAESVSKAAWEQPSTSMQYEFLPGVHIPESIRTPEKYNTSNSNFNDQSVKEECNLLNVDSENSKYTTLNNKPPNGSMINYGNETNNKSYNEDHITAANNNTTIREHEENATPTNTTVYNRNISPSPSQQLMQQHQQTSQPSTTVSNENVNVHCTQNAIIPDNNIVSTSVGINVLDTINSISGNSKIIENTPTTSVTQNSAVNHVNSSETCNMPGCNNVERESNIINYKNTYLVNSVKNNNYNTLLHNFALKNTNLEENNNNNNNSSSSNNQAWNEDDDDDDDVDIGNDNINAENDRKNNSNNYNYINTIIDDDIDDDNINDDDDDDIDLDSNIKDFEEWWLNNQLTYSPSDDEMEINHDKEDVSKEQHHKMFELQEEQSQEQIQLVLPKNQQQNNVISDLQLHSQENVPQVKEESSSSAPQVTETTSASRPLQSTSQLAFETNNTNGNVDGQHVSELLPPPPPSYNAHHCFVRPGLPFTSLMGGVHDELNNNQFNNNNNNNIVNGTNSTTNLPIFAGSSSSTFLPAANSTLSPSLLPFQVKPISSNVNNVVNTQPLQTQPAFNAPPLSSLPPPPTSTSSLTFVATSPFPSKKWNENATTLISPYSHSTTATISNNNSNINSDAITASVSLLSPKLPPPPPPPPPPPHPLPFPSHAENKTPVVSSATPLLHSPIPKSNTSLQSTEPLKQQQQQQQEQHPQTQQEQFHISPSVQSATSTKMSVNEEYESSTLNKTVDSEQRNATQMKTPMQTSSTPQLPVYTPKVHETKLPYSNQVVNSTVGVQQSIQMQHFSTLPTSSSASSPINVLPGGTIASQTANLIANASMPTSYRIMTTTSGQTVLVPAGFTLCEAPMSLAMQSPQNVSLNTMNSYNTCANASNDATINNNSNYNISSSNKIGMNNTSNANSALQQPIQFVNVNSLNKLINNNNSSDNVIKSNSIVSGNAQTLISCNSLPSYTQNLLALQQHLQQQYSQTQQQQQEQFQQQQQQQQVVLQAPISLSNNAIPLTFTTQPNVLHSSTLSVPVGNSANQPVMVYSLLPAATSSGSAALPMQPQIYTAAMPQAGVSASILQSTLPKICLPQQQQQQFLPNMQTLLPRREQIQLHKHQNTQLFSSTITNTTH